MIILSFCCFLQFFGVSVEFTFEGQYVHDSSDDEGTCAVYSIEGCEKRRGPVAIVNDPRTADTVLQVRRTHKLKQHTVYFFLLKWGITITFKEQRLISFGEKRLNACYDLFKSQYIDLQSSLPEQF